MDMDDHCPSEEKVFRVLLLLQVYDVKLCDIEHLLRDKLRQNFHHIDYWLRSMKRPHISWGAAKALDPSEPLLNLHCDVKFHSSGFTLGRISWKPKTSYFFGRTFSHSRFLAVRLSELDAVSRSASSSAMEQFYGPRLLFENGLVLAGRCYRFLYGKEYKSKNGNGLMAYFFAVGNTDTMLNLTTAPLLNYTSIDNVINALGKFPEDIRPEKLNARLQLGFSKSYPFPVLEAFVIIRDDIHGKNIYAPLGQSLPSGHIMTDGCGFISASLARHIPYGISSGRVRGHDYHMIPSQISLRPEDYPLPAIIQVRLVSSLGLFKGCLLVTSDTSLCNTDCIVMRPSMKKADGPLYRPSSSDADDEADIFDRVATLDIVNTFEQPDVNACKIAGENCFVHLNKFSCFFLHQRGVPTDLFIAKLDDELKRVHNMISSREVASAMVKKYTCYSGFSVAEDGSEDAGVSDEDCEASDSDCEDDDDDGTESCVSLASGQSGRRRAESYKEWHSRVCSMNMRSDQSPAELALQFLEAGHAMTEPVLTQLLKRIQKDELSKLQRFKLRIAGGFNLPGAPDPTGTLQPDEIYVSLPISKDRVQAYSKLPSSNSQAAGSVVTGKVVVIRTPTLHQDEIRVMQAVRNDNLAQFLKGTAGGVLFFSTQGHRSAADEMGTGDFDGDIYSVLFCSNELVNAVEYSNPVDYTTVGTASTDSLASAISRLNIHQTGKGVNQPLTRSNVVDANNDLYHLRRFEGLIETAQNALLGVSTNRLLALLDNPEYGPSHPSTRHCFQLTMQLLDSAKSDMDIVFNRDFFKVPFPHYMKRTRKGKKTTNGLKLAEDNAYHSTSVLGNMYDRVHHYDTDEQNRIVLPPQSHVIPQCKCGQKCQIFYNGGRQAWICNKKSPEKCKFFVWFDEMCTPDEDLCCEELYPELASEEIESPHREEHASLIAKWTQLYITYNQSMQDIMNGADHTAILSPGANGSRCSLLRSQSLTTDRKSEVVHMQTHFRGIFDEDVLDLCRGVQEKYLRGVDISDGKGKFFCWEVCGRELHYLKAEALKRKSGQSPLLLLPKL